MNISNLGKYIANPTLGRKAVTSLTAAGAILPVVLLETTVTGGRTHKAHKRGGFVEARERVTEESLGAIFWLFGATMFGKLFQKMGEKFLNIPKEDIDVGRGAARKPFKNFVLDNLGKANCNENKLARFYFGKVIASLVTACLFIGLVVPKMNQAITKYIFKHKPENEKDLTAKDLLQKQFLFKHHNVNINSVSNFKRNAGSANPSFKSAAVLTQIAQKFQENAIYKLLGTDVGTVSGRTINARNKDERIEILVRDVLSIPFYVFTTDLVIKLLNAIDKYKGKNTNINPTTAMEIHNMLLEKMPEEKMTFEAFEKFALGNNSQNSLYEKIFPKQAPVIKSYLGGLIKIKKPVDYQTIELSKFNELIRQNITDPVEANRLINLGKEMSGLQPEIRVLIDKEKNTVASKKILTESQVKDIFSGGELKTPEFMKKALNNVFKTKSHPNRLTDPYQYISQKSIEGVRSDMIDYVNSIIEYAKNNKFNEITPKLMKKVNSRNLIMKGSYLLTGMAFSALFLSNLIPTFQYWVTKKRTGKNEFPGTENMKRA